MEIIYIDSIKEFEQINDKANDVCIGFFDAVHRGHDAVLKNLEQSELQKIVLTFDSHPNKVSILSIESKIELLKQYAIDYIVVIRFNIINQNVSVQEFINFLNVLNVHQISVGNDFRFAKKAEGTVTDLKQHFVVNIVEFVNDGGEKVASRNLREAIFNGDLAEFEKLTGRKYALNGVVVLGDQIGRTINFPTANLATKDLVIRSGVYITEIEIDGQIYKGITNVGQRPTINGKKLQIESHIFDFNDIIYNKQIRVIFHKLIRLETKFESLDALKAQIEKDKEYAKEYYGN